VDLVQFLSDWLIYAADNVKARKPQHVWKMFGLYGIKCYEMQKLHMSSKQTCTCLTHALYTKCENGCVCVNEATIDFHHVFAVKLRNTSRRNIKQRWVSWSIPVVPEASVETQTRATKGQKTGRAEAIQTGFAFSTLPLFVFVCSVSTWEKSEMLTSNTSLATYCQNHRYDH